MRNPLRRSLAPLALALLAISAAPHPEPPHAAAGAPSTPPDGTYAYALSRNGTERGHTTVSLYRRRMRSEVETGEAGNAGAASLTSIAAFGFADLGIDRYVATYRAPFLRTSPLGRVDEKLRPHASFAAPVTVRYDTSSGALRATVDGAGDGYLLGPSANATTTWVIDAPFMTSVALLPVWIKRTNATSVSWTSHAFGDGSIATGKIHRTTAAPHFAKTPKNAVALQIDGFGTIWYDPGNSIVFEAHFDRINMDANLQGYSRDVAVGVAEAPQATPAPPSIPSRPVSITAAGFDLSGTIDEAGHDPDGSGTVVVFVPPAPQGDRNFDDAGPQPMYVDLARGLVAHGVSVLRYDARGIGKSGGDAASARWEDAMADAVSAIDFAQAEAAFDSLRVYVLGFGNGADLALAAAASADVSQPVAGVVALAPTTMRYRECAKRTGADLAHPSVFDRSAYAHDPAALATRSTVPMFVLQPGQTLCGATAEEVTAYDDALRAANPNATVIAANDLTSRFGGRYDADAPSDTQEFFPYRFDPSTLDALADWLTAPKTHDRPTPKPLDSGAAPPPPPPPPAPHRTAEATPSMPPSPSTSKNPAV